MTEVQLLFVVFLGTSVLFVVLGIPLWRQRIPPNAWYGFRTPATRGDERIWYPANRVTGIWLVVIGISTILACAGAFVGQLDVAAAMVLNVSVMMSLVCAMLAHCFVVLNRLKKSVNQAQHDD